MDKQTTQRIVIIGAVAVGPKTACRLKRLKPDADVVMVDEDERISYGGCGIPYFISGDISNVRELMSTSYHAVNLQGGVATLRKMGVLDPGHAGKEGRED